MIQTTTERGFDLIEFTDRYDNKCSIQKSSLASEDAIWIGVSDANPQIMASQAAAHGVTTEATSGWVSYPIPEVVNLSTRMHLTQEQVLELLPILNHFAFYGELPKAKP